MKQSYATSHAPQVQGNQEISSKMSTSGGYAWRPTSVRQWIHDDNKGIEIMGTRWLMQEHLPGKVASSVVIDMKSAVEMGRLRMGRRAYNTERYDWDCGTPTAS